MTNRKMQIMTMASLIFFGVAGGAYAEAINKDIVRDDRGQIIRATNGTCVRTKWDAGGDLCAPQKIVQQTVTQKTVVEQRKARPTAEFSREERTVYFDFDRSALLPEALRRLDTLVDALKADKTVKRAHIVGYADRIGSDSYNERLSQKRAKTVYDYLIAKGYTNADVTETRWVGEREPSTDCPAGARSKLISCLQNDRRVEIAIEYVEKK